MVMQSSYFFVFFAVLVVFCGSVSGEASSNKYVNVALKSNWDSTPLYQEARYDVDVLLLLLLCCCYVVVV
jgi:hypothetical protein